MNDLPEGWVPLSHFDSKDRKKSDGHSTEYKHLLAAVKAGQLRGLQDAKSRRYYVPQEEADRLLLCNASEPGTKESPCIHGDDLQYGVMACLDFVRQLRVERTGLFDCVNSAVAAMERMEGAIERIALAAEAMATQPRDQVGSWRDMNGEAMN